MAAPANLAAPHWLTPRMAVTVTFLCFGLGVGLWGGAVPVVTRAAGMSPEQLGTAIVGFGIAGILGMAASGRIAASVSLKNRLLALLAMTALCLAALLYAASPFVVMAGLFAFSFLGASVDLVMNSEGIAVEREHGYPILTGFHAMSSVGVAGGSFLGSYLSVNFGIGATAVTAIAIYAIAMLAIVLATPNRGPTQPAGGGSSWFKPSTPFIVLSIMVGVSIAIELSTIMFSAKALAAAAPTLAAYAGVGATIYALIQAATRFGGDRLRARFGDMQVLVASLAIAALGLAIVTMSGGFAMLVIGFAFVGLGTACIVPSGFALAPNLTTATAAAAISTVSIIGAPFRIVAPMIYGAVSGGAGFAFGYSIYLALAVIAFVLGLVMLRQTHR